MDSIMRAALNMAAAYHTPVDYWIGIPVAEFCQWATTARDMTAEAQRSESQQRI